MKMQLALVFDRARRAHFIAPAHVVSITATGGNAGTEDKPNPVIEITLSSGRVIEVQDLGNTEEDAITNLIEQLQEDAIEPLKAAPSEKI